MRVCYRITRVMSSTRRILTATWTVVLLVSIRGSDAHTSPSLLDNFEAPRLSLDPNITLSVTPRGVRHGGWVTVAWTGIESWRFPDAFVAAFSPGSVLDHPASISEVAPVKYQYLTAGQPFPGKGAVAEDTAEPSAREGDEGAIQSLRFRLLDLRDEEGYRFGLFKGGVKTPVLVAKTDAVSVGGNLEAMHVHLALTSEPRSMRVSWVSGHKVCSPTVRYRRVTSGAKHGTAWKALQAWQSEYADSTTYGREDMCGPPATTKGFHDPGQLLTVVLSNLVPGQPYEYQAGDDADVWSESAIFHAPPEPSSAASAFHGERAHASSLEEAIRSGQQEDRKRLRGDGRGGGGVSRGGWGPDAVKVGVFGDMGTAEVDGTLDAGHTEEVPSLQTVRMLLKHLGASSAQSAGSGGPEGEVFDSQLEPELGLVVHIGDLSYARGYDTQWDEYLDMISPVASAVPWMVGVGNHERDYPSTSRSRQGLSYYTGTDSGGECGVPTAFRFPMPGAAEDPNADSPWYSFDFGPVHFTIMSTEHDFTPGSVQHSFIESDLAGVDRSKTPWVVFAGHRPMYVNSEGPGANDCEGSKAEEEHCANDQPVAKLLRTSLEPLLVRYQVDLGVYGHHHSYQRTCKVENAVCKGLSSESSADEPEGHVAPVHVVLGMAGMGLSQNMASPRPEWLEYATDREYGVCVLVADSSRLQLSFTLNVDGQVADQMTLTKPDALVQVSDATDAKNGMSGSEVHQIPESVLATSKKSVSRAIEGGRARSGRRGFP